MSRLLHLTGNEVEQLFRIIRDLRSRGVSIIYISHKMEEILEISDEVTIMRDGTKIGTWASSELTTDMIISKMVGRDLKERFPERSNVPNGVLMKVEGLTSVIPNHLRMYPLIFVRERFLELAVLLALSGQN